MYKIKKAIIPLAGLATRMYPLSKVVKKAFLPVIDIDGRIKPLLLTLVEELDNIGIQEINLIIGKDDKELYERLFAVSKENILNKLNEKDKEYEMKLNKISKKIRYIIQEEPLGFAHAVYISRENIGKEACVLVLGDTVYKSNNKLGCIEQVLKYYDEIEEVVIGLHKLDENQLKYYATINGEWDNIEKNKISLNKIIEKPSIETAKKELQLDGNFYGNFGIFILNDDVFNALQEVISKPPEENKEWDLMKAFDVVIKTKGAKGLVIDGVSYDAGNIEAYKKVMREF